MTYDPRFPEYGAAILADDFRQAFASVATDNYGVADPRVPAQITGDLIFRTLNLSTKYTVTITVDNTTQVVDLRGTSPAQTTVYEVAAAINAAFASVGISTAVASVVSAPPTPGGTLDGYGFVRVTSPTKGSTSVVTIGSGDTATDAQELVFGLAGRGTPLPLTSTGASLPVGSKLQTSSSIQIRQNKPAIITGTVDWSTSRNQSVRRHLRIKIVTATATFGPLTIDITGSNAASVSASTVRDAINNAFRVLSNWPNPSQGPATIVSYGGKQYIRIVSGPSGNPSTGPQAKIVFSELTGSPPLPLADDALPDVFGIATGVDNRSLGRVPITVVGIDWTTNFIRGLDNRAGSGIGVWGPPVETKLDLVGKALYEGEKRIALNSGVTWVTTRTPNTSLAWRRDIPRHAAPIIYDRDAEFLTLRKVPYDPSTSYLGDEQGAADNPNDVGAAMVAVNARSWSANQTTHYAGAAGSHRTLFGPAPVIDDFIYSVSVGSAAKIAPSLGGGDWSLPGAFASIANNRIWEVSGAAVYPGSQSTAGTLQWQLLSRPASYYVQIGSNTGAAQNLGFQYDLNNIKDVSGQTINPNSLSVYVLKRGSSSVAPIVYAQAWAVDGTNFLGDVNIDGTYVDNGTTKIVDITVLNMPQDYVVVCYFGLGNDIARSLNVVASVGKYEGESNAGTECEAGVVYAARVDTFGEIDHDTGFQLTLSDAGVLRLSERTGIGSATQVGILRVEEPLRYIGLSDSDQQILRVLYIPDPNANIAVHLVYIGGSIDEHDWVPESLINPGTAITGEEDSAQPRLVGTFVTPISAANQGNAGMLCGIALKGVASASGVPAKSVFVKEFRAYGGTQYGPLGSMLPAAPPLSGALLRDTISAIRVINASGVDVEDSSDNTRLSTTVTDCPVGAPLFLQEPSDGTIELALYGGTTSDTRRRIIPKVAGLTVGSSANTLFHVFDLGVFSGSVPTGASSYTAGSGNHHDHANQSSGLRSNWSGSGSVPADMSFAYNATLNGVSGMPSFTIDEDTYEYYPEIVIVGSAVRSFSGTRYPQYGRITINDVQLQPSVPSTVSAAALSFDVELSHGWTYYLQLKVTRIKKAQ